MIDRQNGKLLVECDSCGEVLDTETADFNEAREMNEARGLEGAQDRQRLAARLPGLRGAGMNLHRILSGSPEHRAELIAAGLFVLVWFAMDLAQWIDWANSKLNPPPSICGLLIGPPPTITQSTGARP